MNDAKASRPTMPSSTSGTCCECKRMVWAQLRDCTKCWKMWCPACWIGHKCAERERPFILIPRGRSM